MDKKATDPAFAGKAAPNDFATYKTNYAKKFASTLSTFGHFAINIVDAKTALKGTGPSGFNAATGKVDLVVDYSSPSVINAVTN